MRPLRISVLLLVAACEPDVPPHPKYFGDVQPILGANCVRCHGADPYDPRIASFRLDRYVQGDEATLDVWDYRETIVNRAVDLERPAMPPDVPLSDRQREILRRWVEQGAQKGTRDNAAPRIELVSASACDTDCQTIGLAYRAWDDDGDGLAISVGAREQGSGEVTMMRGNLGGGLRAIDLDVGTLPSMRFFDLFAILDDGYFDDPAQNRLEVTLVSSFYVDHGLRGTAPTVVLLEPNGGETLLGKVPVSWSATDPDAGDVLAIALELVQVGVDGSETVVGPITLDASNLWDTSSVPDKDASGTSILYKLRVTATDAGSPPNVRSDQSDFPFTIARESGVTDHLWADVRTIFVQYCEACHGEPPSNPSNDGFCLSQYDAAHPEPPCDPGNQGVYEKRGAVYQKLVVDGSMPPAVEPQPPGADVDKIGNWILGGAPYGDGPSDAPPAFTWVTPASGTSVAPVDLLAMASDDLGLESGELRAGRVANVFSQQQCGGMGVSCGAASFSEVVTAMEPLAGALTWEKSVPAWTPPMPGCWCLQGIVTDTSGQSTRSVAGGRVWR